MDTLRAAKLLKYVICQKIFLPISCCFPLFQGGHSFSPYAKFSGKLTFLTPNVNFSVSFSYALNEWPQFLIICCNSYKVLECTEIKGTLARIRSWSNVPMRQSQCFGLIKSFGCWFQKLLMMVVFRFNNKI